MLESKSFKELSAEYTRFSQQGEPSQLPMTQLPANARLLKAERPAGKGTPPACRSGGYFRDE